MTAAESSKKSFVAVINPPDLIFVSWARARCRIPHLGFLPAGDDSANPPPTTPYTNLPYDIGCDPRLPWQLPQIYNIQDRRVNYTSKLTLYEMPKIFVPPWQVCSA